MKRPIKGKLVAAGGDAIEILGMLADAPQGRQVGHTVADDLQPILAALGDGQKITLHLDKEPVVEVELTVIELQAKTIRFRIHA